MDRLYFGGAILTMAPGPRPEALLVSGGRVAAVGVRRELAALSPGAAETDLAGAALLPAFIDAHSHLAAAAHARLQLDLSGCDSEAALAARLAAHLRETRPAPGQWVLARGYDHNALREGAHPDRAALDAAAPDNPVVLQHASGHMGVFNSAALAALGVTEKTPAPEGGRIGLRDGRLTGYMEENAFLDYLRRAPAPDTAALLAAFADAQRWYASFGVVTAQEGMLTRELAPLYRRLAATGALVLDVVGYADEAEADEVRALLGGPGRGYAGRFRLGGYKIFLDGSPQGRTAWLLEDYAGRPGDRGYGVKTDAEVLGDVLRAARDGMQLLAHCNGDAAAAQLLDALARARDLGADLDALHTVMIHAQLLAPEQLPRLRELGVTPSFFVAHVLHWGDAHLQNLGARRAARISCAGSALRAGLPFTFHQDAPVIAPDMLETAACAVLRRTRAGRQLGPGEAVPVLAALRAVTLDAARQYGEAAEKGSLAPGKRADLVLLERDPTAVPPETLASLRVLETVRAGETIFRR